MSGVVELDLTRHADKIGCVYSDARATVFRVLSPVPAGVAVRVRLGRAQWLDAGVLDLLAEMVEDVRAVEVVGADDRGVGQVVTGLRARLEAA